jgi:hypothetical protein
MEKPQDMTELSTKNDDAVGTALKSNRKMTETETQSISLTFLSVYRHNNKQWLA